MNKTILVTGGAGYIGSHSVYLLSKLGYNIIVIDKLLHGQVWNHPSAKFFQADFADEQVLTTIFKKYNISAVMHFAAFIEVGESVKKPADFYQNNVVKVLKLLDVMRKNNIEKFIFSSSCAVYGNPVRIPMDENHPTNPVSPYGRNKLIVEYALQDYAHAYGLKFVSLRYFNAAGALPDVGLGEQHKPETHIIPLLLRAIAQGSIFKIFGTDYKTDDGTCVRDYIHVADIARAHVLALSYLERFGKSDFFNLGTGNGYTVLQVVQMAEEVFNKKAITQKYSRRPGDAEVLLADPSRAKKVLQWEPKTSDLRTIISSALAWERKMQTLIN